jgi:hypothetical protein
MVAKVIVGLLICGNIVLLSSDEENPFKKANIGDWVEYKLTSSNFDGKTKMTVIAKDDKEVTYEVAAKVTFMGNEMAAPLQRQKIDLTKSYDPIVSANLQGSGVKFETEGSGNEKLKLGSKEYETHWTKLKATATLNNVMIVTEYKMWFCKDVPLSGLIRMDTTTSGVSTRLEMIGSGGK